MSGCSANQLATIAWMRELKGDPPVAFCPACLTDEHVSSTGMGRGATGLTDDGDPCAVCDGDGYLDAEDAEEWELSS